jgi:hypothetical protein
VSDAIAESGQCYRYRVAGDASAVGDDELDRALLGNMKLCECGCAACGRLTHVTFKLRVVLGAK